MFDAIVIGSGMSGGIAAKELCERGLKVLVIERGRKIEHGADYMDSQMPWELPNNNKIPEAELARDYAVQGQCYAVNEATKKFWVKAANILTPRQKESHLLGSEAIILAADQSCGGGKAIACRRKILRRMPRMAMAATGQSAMKTSHLGTIMLKNSWV